MASGSTGTQRSTGIVQSAPRLFKPQGGRPEHTKWGLMIIVILILLGLAILAIIFP